MTGKKYPSTANSCPSILTCHPSAKGPSIPRPPASSKHHSPRPSSAPFSKHSLPSRNSTVAIPMSLGCPLRHSGDGSPPSLSTRNTTATVQFSSAGRKDSMKRGIFYLSIILLALLLCSCSLDRNNENILPLTTHLERFPTFSFTPPSGGITLLGGNYCDNETWPLVSFTIHNDSKEDAMFNMMTIPVTDCKIEFYGMNLPCNPGDISWVTQLKETVNIPAFKEYSIQYSLAIPNSIPSGFYSLGIECQKQTTKYYHDSGTFILTNNTEQYVFPLIIRINRTGDEGRQPDYYLQQCSNGILP